MAGRKCNICGKILRGHSDEALAAHQRESESCLSSTANATPAVARLEARLKEVIENGRKLGMGEGRRAIAYRSRSTG